MKRTAILFVLLLMIPALGRAQDAPAAPSPAAPSPAAPNQVAPAAVPADYRLSAGDVIEIKFFFDPELNDTIQIRPDGKISFQLIGDVQLAGKTVASVVDELQKDYAKQLKNPVINLQIRTYGSQKIYVVGEVTRPGLVNMPGPLSVTEALGEAGGIKQTGNVKKVILIRKGANNAPERRELKLSEHGQPTLDAELALQPFDMILVPETKISKVDHWVDQYLKQTNPTTMVSGFQYIWNHQGGAAASTIPF